MSSQSPFNHNGPDEHGKILIVDDEFELTNALSEMLSRHGFETQGFTNGNAALQALNEQSFDILLADLMMPGMDGISLLKAALKIDPNLIGIIMTGQGTVQTAVEAMKSGAFDYIMKPFKLNTILTTLNRSLEVRYLKVENVQLRELLHVYELGQVVAFTLDSSLILQKTAEAALEQCQADEVSILLSSEDRQDLYVANASGGQREHLIGEIVPVTGTIAGWVAHNFEPLFLDGEVADTRFTAAHPRPDIETSISMPMLSGKKLVGIMNLNWTQRHPPLNQGQIKGLTLLVGIAASAVDNARLYKQTEKRLGRLAALRTIDLAITSSLDLRVTFRIVLEQVMNQLGVDAAAVLLLNPHTQHLEYAAGEGFRSHALENIQVFLGEGFGGMAALEQKTVHVPNLVQAGPDPARQYLISNEEIQSAYYAPLRSKGAVQGVLEVFCRSPLTPDTEWLAFLEALAGQAAIAIDNTQLFDNLQRSNQQLMLAYNATIEGWSRALDLRDKETEGHTQRVTDVTLRLANAMGLFSPEDLVHIRRGALLHDIGKMGVPDNILLKPGELDKDEEAQMRKHPDYAYQLLSPILYLRKALDIPHYHHEWWDGSGYPQGLKGEQIPIAARIFAVVDVWDALRSDRPYRAGWPEEQVLEHIRGLSGTQFDPQVVAAFAKMMADGN